MGVIRACLRGALCLLGLWSALAWAQPAERTHTVERKETAYSIAQRYGVDLNRLFELNRWAEGGIRKGDVLRIPRRPAGRAARCPSRGPCGPRGGRIRCPPHRTRIRRSCPLTPPSEMPRARPVPPHWPGDTVRVAVLLPFSAGQDSLGRQAERLRDIALDCASGIRSPWIQVGGWAPMWRCGSSIPDWTRRGHAQRPRGPRFRWRPGGRGGGALSGARHWEDGAQWPAISEAVHLVLTDLGAPLVVDAPGLLFPSPRTMQRMAALAQHVAEASRRRARHDARHRRHPEPRGRRRLPRGLGRRPTWTA